MRRSSQRKRWLNPKTSKAEAQLLELLGQLEIPVEPQGRVTGMHKPWDFVFRDLQLIVELDGCYWHGCLTCHPTTGGKKGLKRSRDRHGYTAKDRLQSGRVRKLGWTLLRFWEHEYLADGFCSVIAEVLTHQQRGRADL